MRTDQNSTGGVPFGVWGEIGLDIDEQSAAQMRSACALPVAVAGALMPDAHVGYGLPIGGVLATRDAVVPYAVGVDIGCRMKLSVLDLPLETLDHEHGRSRLRKVLESETRFGVGGEFERPKQHAVMDRDWGVSPVTARHKDRAWRQLGTSGSGNHFVEFGVLTVMEGTPRSVRQSFTGGSKAELDLAPGRYLALLSHSGSRGTGFAVCDHYSRLAMRLRPDLPKGQERLAWLDMSTSEGVEYFDAMNLMAEYASANHECIHRGVAKALGVGVLAGVENHHNFAWREEHADPKTGKVETLYVHRKGATPAGEGGLGVIPGSMSAPGYVVRGRGSTASLSSASHGAGRVMSRTKAREAFRWGNVKRELEAAGIEVLSAGLDESPGVYKDIERVMSLQRDLVDVVARFDPRLVKMAPEGERAED